MSERDVSREQGQAGSDGLQARHHQPVGRRSFLMATLARETLRDAARALDARGIPLIPLKGVLFQLVLYEEPAQRLLTDVDVLVRERDFVPAIGVLREAGFALGRATRSRIGFTLRSPARLTIDLHRRLFSPARYRLSTQSVFARATRDERLLGVPLYLAHPHDIAAHVIGKFVSDHVVDERVAWLRELLLWIRQQRLESAGLAAHLHATGLARAARYVLSCGVDLIGDPYFGQLLAQLPPDPVGAICARASRRLIPLWQESPFAAAPAHLLNASLPRAVASATWVSVNRMRHAFLSRVPNRGPGES